MDGSSRLCQVRGQDSNITEPGNYVGLCGIKFFCTEQVSYQLRIGIDDFYEGISVTRSGVAGESFAEGYSSPCVNSLNSGWEVWAPDKSRRYPDTQRLQQARHRRVPGFVTEPARRGEGLGSVETWST